MVSEIQLDWSPISKVKTIIPHTSTCQFSTLKTKMITNHALSIDGVPILKKVPVKKL